MISETSFYVGIVQNSFEEENLKKEYAYFKRRGFEKWLVYYKNKPIVPKSIGKTDGLPDWPDSLKDLKCFICLNLPFCIQYCLDCRRYWCKQCWNDEIVRSNFCFFKPKPNGRDAGNNQSYLGYREHRLGDISIEKAENAEIRRRNSVRSMPWIRYGSSHEKIHISMRLSTLLKVVLSLYAMDAISTLWMQNRFIPSLTNVSKSSRI